MLRLFVFITCFVFLTQPIFAQNPVITIKSIDDLLLVGKQVTFFEDTKGTLTLQDVLRREQEGKFQLNDKQVFARPATQSAFWFKIVVQNHSSEDIWLEIGSTYAWFIDFYAPNEQNEYNTPFKTGTLRPEKSKAYNVNLFWLPLNKANDRTSKAYYIRVTEVFPFELPLQIGTIRSLSANKDVNDYLTAGFVGLLVIMVLYNSFLYLSTKDHIYVYYIAYLFLMMLGMTYANGYPFIQYIEIGFLTKEVWNQYFLVWHPPVYAFVGLFCIKYLNLGEKKGKWIKRSLLFGIVVLSVLFPILNLWLGTFGALITPFQGLLLLFYLTCLFTSYYFAFRKDKQARFYAIGWTFMIVFVFIFFAVINGFLPFNPFMRNALYFGVACEVWMFSLALGDRMNIIRREKEQMQVENLRLVQEQNAMLERKVEERTLQLKEANEELQQTNEELQTTVEAVEKERLKSDNLLLNILPTQVAQELKNYGFARPQRYELASILFTDFKGFTQIVSNMKPEQVLDNLNYCFTAFDKIIRKNNLEKIKTIGDAYMCVGGVPTADKDNPIRIATAALEMLAFIKEWKAKKIKQGKEAWDLRIGIHTGAVVAGVVGDYKFAYDIWGDAVNLASRMESSGEVSKINISEDTYLHIKDHFYCTYRGEIEAKHKGKIKMYFLDSVLEDNSRKIE